MRLATAGRGFESRPVAVEFRPGSAVRADRAMMEDMDATVLEVLTALLSFVSAVGVLVVNSKVDRLTGRVDALEATLHMVVTVVMGRKLPSSGSD